MGYLNNSTVSVDAILTKKGRELLAQGQNMFNITQFALADDEIDYGLWNPSHPNGSDYYGIIIENLPLVEASPDETQVMKYKLVTLPKSTPRIPVLYVPQTSITLTAPGQVADITPSTVNFLNGNATLGYTAIISDQRVAQLVVAPGGAIPNSISPTTPSFIGDATANFSVAVAGLKFSVIANTFYDADRTTTITIIGNETGGRVTVNLTVKKVTVNTQLQNG